MSRTFLDRSDTLKTDRNMKQTEKRLLKGAPPPFLLGPFDAVLEVPVEILAVSTAGPSSQRVALCRPNYNELMEGPLNVINGIFELIRMTPR